MQRVAFRIFNVDIYWYSICILIGIILAYLIISKESKKHEISNEFISNTIFYTVIIGVIGARIYYVIFNLDYYINNPQEILMIRNGGLAIHGGIIFGLLFNYFNCKKYKINFLKIMDIFVPGVIVAQAIGRWGNFFNSEAHGGIVTYKILKKMFIPNFIIKGMKIDGIYYYPTFYFESLWCILGFILMKLIQKNKKLNIGIITSFYFIWYSFGRFFIELLRTDSLMLFSIKVAQLVSIIGIIIGISIIIYSNKKNEKYYK